MHRFRHRIAFALLALLGLSCASSSELARRSERALGSHDFERAYKEAVASLAKDPSNGRGRMALSAAAAHLIDERQQRIVNLAATDSVDAANACLELDELRADALSHGAILSDPTEFVAKETRIRHGAAGIRYRAALASLKLDKPKLAYHQLLDVRRFQPGFRDIDTRLPKVWERAVTRVAVLPFDDETGTEGLSRVIADRMTAELRSRSKAFEFTQIVPSDQVYEAMHVAQLGDMTKDEAVELGRKLGASRVVFGRFHNLRTRSDNDRYHGTIWRRHTDRDTSGHDVERYADIPFDAIERWRQVELQIQFQVIDVASEAAVVDKSRDLDATAHTLYSDFVPEGDVNAYVLVPPSLKEKDPDRCARAEQDWHSTFKGWTVPKFLERAKRDHSHRHYRSEYRDQFVGLDADHPVFLDDIPSAPDLLQIALDDSWKGVLDALRELDPED